MNLYWYDLDAERLHGKLRGELRGELKGELNGRWPERVNTARILLARGVGDATILCTGLTEEQLASVKAGMESSQGQHISVRKPKTVKRRRSGR